MKSKDNKREKEKSDNLGSNEKNSQENTRKKERNVCVIILTMKKRNILKKRATKEKKSKG